MTYTKDSEPIVLAPGRASHIALAAVAVLLLALIFRLGLLGRPPVPDEYLHLLAARGWLETGRPTILDGEYTRVAGFTGAVAWLFSVTGSASFETGRLLAVAAGVLIPTALFLWLRLRIGWSAAVIGAGLAIAWPQGIVEAQTIRFYSWHCLSFLVGAIAIFEAVEAKGARRAIWALVGALSLWLAFRLQITTAIGLVAILGWAGAMLILPVIWKQSHRWLLLGGLFAAGALVLGFLVWSGTLADAWAQYRWTPVWNEHRQDKVTYYSHYLRNTYPMFWPLFPLAALLAFRLRPRFTAYCTLLFGVILLGQSFGGMKALRYLSYGMPFFFAVFAIAGAAILPSATHAVMRAAEFANPTRFRWVSAGLVLVALLFAGMINPFFAKSIDALAGQNPMSRPEPDWTRMPDLLGDWADTPFVLSMRAMHTISSLGDFDVTLSPSTLSELPDQSEFSIDPRNGRPVVAKLDTVATILRCEPEGLIVSNNRFWTPERQLEWMPLFEAAGRSIETREKRQLFALRWSGGAADAAACELLPQ